MGRRRTRGPAHALASIPVHVSRIQSHPDGTGNRDSLIDCKHNQSWWRYDRRMNVTCCLAQSPAFQLGTPSVLFRKSVTYCNIF